MQQKDKAELYEAILEDPMKFKAINSMKRVDIPFRCCSQYGSENPWQSNTGPSITGVITEAQGWSTQRDCDGH